MTAGPSFRTAILEGIHAKIAAAVTVFSVVAETIGLIVGIPEIAKMIAPR
jgi:hypothetical protein